MHTTRAKYQQLLCDLRTELRPQREWCQGRGVYLVVGHFVVGVAGGTWLFSMLLGSLPGLTLAFVLGVAGGMLHLANLGHPLRAWKMGFNLRRSWTSRGFVGLNLFLGAGVLHLLPLWLPGVAWDSESVLAAVVKASSLLGTVTIICYMGFVYTASKAIPFWNSPLHPALYAAYALRGGIAGLLLAQSVSGQWVARPDHLLLSWIGVTTGVILLFALEVHGALTSGNLAAHRSVKELFAGSVSIYFYGGTLLIGLLIPAWLVWSGLSGPTSVHAMAVLGTASILGDFFMKYSTIRAGVYMPVRPPSSPRRHVRKAVAQERDASAS